MHIHSPEPLPLPYHPNSLPDTLPATARTSTQHDQRMSGRAAAAGEYGGVAPARAENRTRESACSVDSRAWLSPAIGFPMSPVRRCADSLRTRRRSSYPTLTKAPCVCLLHGRRPRSARAATAFPDRMAQIRPACADRRASHRYRVQVLRAASYPGAPRRTSGFQGRPRTEERGGVQRLRAEAPHRGATRCGRPAPHPGL
jgi:hypothetical protein